MSVSRRSRVLASIALGVTVTGTAAAAMPSAGAVSTSPTTAKTTNAVLPRTAIPWKNVTKGWVLAEVAKSGTNNLVLVSPGGQSYQVMTISGAHLAQVSPDGRRALLYLDSSLRTVDLASGRTLANVKIYNGGVFSKPDGQGLIGTNESGALVNYSASTGHLLKSGARVGNALWAVVPAPNGQTDVISTANTVKLYNHATLQPMRSFAAPSGFVNCQPQSFVDSTHFREACISKATEPSGPGMAWTSQVFTQSINGGAALPVTSGTYPGGVGQRVPLGFSGAWNTSKGTVASPNVVEMTGSTRLFRMSGGKIAQTYNVPMAADAARMTPIVKTMVGNSAYFTSNLHEPGPSIALRYDVTTNKVNYLAGPHSQYGGTVASYSVIE